jgi:hypothetical protein
MRKTRCNRKFELVGSDDLGQDAHGERVPFYDILVDGIMLTNENGYPAASQEKVSYKDVESGHDVTIPAEPVNADGLNC